MMLFPVVSAYVFPGAAIEHRTEGVSCYISYVRDVTGWTIKLYYRMDEFGILLVLRGAISKFGTKSCYLGH